LLPKYRGAAPIQRAIIDNEASTGLTIMRMDEGLDTGAILDQKEVPILNDETFVQLHDRLAGASGDFLMDFFKGMTRGSIKETVQDSTLATYADKIDKEMSRIDWTRGAKEISALIRGLDPIPGAFTTLGEIHIKLFSSTVSDENFAGTIPGRVLGKEGDFLNIETGKGIISVRELQYPGKKRLPAGEFLRGFHLPDSVVLGKQ
jgi:methionyl-tRNA formyltransferase